jgi:gas vesicle structural protein
MGVERSTGGSSLIDILDRVLEKGIVMDAWAKVSKLGIRLTHPRARVVVTSVETRLKYADPAGSAPVTVRSQLADPEEAGLGAKEPATRQPAPTRMHRAASRK